MRHAARVGGRSWAASSEPCGTGWDSYGSGWRGLICNSEGGRVTTVSSHDNMMGVPAGEIGGDVSGWGALTEAKFMCVHPPDG
jgi:hypothetical protein